MNNIRCTEHFVLSLLGLVALCVCAFKGHGEVSSSIAFIVAAGCGGSAAKDFANRGTDQQDPK